MNTALQGLTIIISGVGGCLAYFYLSNQLLDKVLFPPRGENAGKNVIRANLIRPWLFIFPVIFMMGVYYVYPVFETLRLSLTDRDLGGAFVGLANFHEMFSQKSFLEAMRNNILWLIVVPTASTAIGLLVAQLTDRIAWGNIARTIIFMPMAYSFVGASMAFLLIYDGRPEVGVLNAVWMQFEGGIGSFLFLRIFPAITLLGFAAVAAYVCYLFLRPFFIPEERKGGIISAALRAVATAVAAYLAVLALLNVTDVFTITWTYGKPQSWMSLPFWNNFFLMAVLIWTQTGLAMVILAAALRGIPQETVEAAIIDGVKPFQLFFRIKIPQILGTIVVVWTLIMVVTLRVFDIVFTMTYGNWETEVLANYLYRTLFVNLDWGVGSASVIILVLLVSPIMIYNVSRNR
ncbi:MAG: sugar ABC transporter permease [Gemmatimonadetes bacterium]|nr:sugar ABC transporter permease [Gemmatimonadota bacterium]